MDLHLRACTPKGPYLAALQSPHLFKTSSLLRPSGILGPGPGLSVGRHTAPQFVPITFAVTCPLTRSHMWVLYRCAEKSDDPEASHLPSGLIPIPKELMTHTHHLRRGLFADQVPHRCAEKSDYPDASH